MSEGDDTNSCRWWADEEVWVTSCNETFEFTNEGPRENRFCFCPYCGGRLEVSDE